MQTLRTNAPRRRRQADQVIPGRRVRSGRAVVAVLAAFAAVVGVTATGSPAAATAPLCGNLVDGVHVVTTAAEFAKVGRGSSDCRMSDDYVLAADIDLQDLDADPNDGQPYSWSPIGSGENAGDPTTFSGTFDGAGNSITGLFIDYTGELAYDDASISNKGLFGVTGTGAVIRDVTVSGSVRGGTRVGGVIGATFGTTVSGVVANVTVSGLNVVGGLIGQAHDSQIIGSTSNGAVYNTNADQDGGAWFYGTGGLIGVGERIGITGSLATGDVTAVKYDPASPGTELGRSSSVGGLLGDSNTWATISASSATGDVTGSYFVGGLVGYMWADGTDDGHDRSLVDVSATGRVDGVSSVGGLVGSLSTDGTVQRASASGDVVATAPSSSTDRSAGGLIGWAASYQANNSPPSDGVGPKLVVSDVSASGDVVADGEYVGGLIGGADEVDITNASATGSLVEGRRWTGGLVGWMKYSSIVGGVASGTLVEGGNQTGGLVGFLQFSSVVGGVAHADVSGSAGAFMIGGLIGEADGTPSDETLISESAAYGDVSGQAGVGGLVGYNNWWMNIERSFALGDVTGVELVGGLVGEAYDIDIVDSFARGAVTAVDAKAGALAGLFNDFTGGTSSISRSYATGAVLDTDPTNGDGNAAPGGLIVDNSINATTGVGATVSASYWDATVSGVTSSTQGGDPKSTDELTTLSTFSDAGWAIVDGWAPSNPPTAVWGICAAVNDGYPFLLWAYDADPCVSPQSGDAPPPPPPASATSGESAIPGGAVARGGFVPTTPQRLLDTRDGTHLAGGQIVEVAIAGRNGVPVGATAVALGITAVDPAGSGFVTVFPCGTTRPVASTLNVVADEIVANAATVALGANGAVCMFASTDTDVLVDLTGYWSPTGTGFFSPIAPTRVHDTRNVGTRAAGGDTVVVDVSTVVPAGAVAVALNVTAVDTAGAGFATVFPCSDGRPLASNLNVTARSTVAVSALVGRGSDGRVCVFTSTAMDVVVDVTGWFGATGTAGLVAAGPTRLLDTRDGAGRTAAGSITRVKVPAGAAAVALNVTAVDPSAASYITVFPCATTTPRASNLNVVAGNIRANQVVVGAAGGEVCITTQAPTHLVIDHTATFAP